MASTPSLAQMYGAAETSTFLGLPSCSDLSQLHAPIAILGAPGATPYASVGAYCRSGPAALRRAVAPLSANMERHDFDAAAPLFPAGAPKPADCGDIPFSATDFAANRRAIHDAVKAV